MPLQVSPIIIVKTIRAAATEFILSPGLGKRRFDIIMNESMAMTILIYMNGILKKLSSSANSVAADNGRPTKHFFSFNLWNDDNLIALVMRNRISTI